MSDMVNPIEGLEMHGSGHEDAKQQNKLNMVYTGTPFLY